jgi:uncharacterized protein
MFTLYPNVRGGTIPAAAPVPPAEGTGPDRVAVLDILRGLALLGMFMVHFNYYEATPLGTEPGRAAAAVERILELFFSERFYGIFGMLFGVGFAIQLERAEARGTSFVARYFRRLAALAVFGFIAEGVFGFNVLFGYAVWGVPLLLVRRWPVKALFVLLIVCASARPILSIAKVSIASRTPGGIEQLNARQAADMAAFRAARDSVSAIEKSGDWGAVVSARTAFMPRFHRMFGILPNMSFTLFLLGLIGYRLGLFTRPGEHRRLIVSLMAFGVGTFLVATYVLPIGGPIQRPAPEDQSWWTAFVISARMGFQLLRPQWLFFTYVGAVLLLVAANPAWITRLSFLSWPGRMALTNYMMHIVLLEVLFTPHGFGLALPAPVVFPAAMALFAAQMAMGRWWLGRFRHGPLEWLWKAATNWDLPPMRGEATPVAVAMPA